MERKTVISNVRIYTGTGKIIEKGALSFRDGTICEISEGSDPLRGDLLIDGQGATLMPGLIDCHVHLGYGMYDEDISEKEQELLIISQLKEFPGYGITTVRNMATKWGSDIKVRDRIKRGEIKGPGIIACGEAITSLKGHGWPMSKECANAGQVAAAADEILSAGADFIKIIATGGMMTKGSIPNAPQFTAEEMAMAVKAADQAGLLTAAHCTGLEGAKRAILAGVRSIEHIPMDEEIASLMKEHDCFYVPTIVTRYNILHTEDPQYVHMREKAKPEDLEKKRAAISRCLRYGIPICAGTDAIGGRDYKKGLTILGESLLTELMIYHEYGMSCEAVLASATSTAAKMLGIDHLTGSLEIGKRADLNLVFGKPDEDLTKYSKNSPTSRRFV